MFILDSSQKHFQHKLKPKEISLKIIDQIRKKVLFF